jgi:hypothetical protein
VVLKYPNGNHTPPRKYLSRNPLIQAESAGNGVARAFGEAYPVCEELLVGVEPVLPTPLSFNGEVVLLARHCGV